MISKAIRFNLMMDGVPVRSVEELRAHFNADDALDLLSSGLMERRLRTRGEETAGAVRQLQKVLTASTDHTAAEKTALSGLLRAFDLEYRDVEDFTPVLHRRHLRRLWRQERAAFEAHRAGGSQREVLQQTLSQLQQRLGSLGDLKNDPGASIAEVSSLLDAYRPLFSMPLSAWLQPLIKTNPVAALALHARLGKHSPLDDAHQEALLKRLIDSEAPARVPLDSVTNPILNNGERHRLINSFELGIRLYSVDVRFTDIYQTISETPCVVLWAHSKVMLRGGLREKEFSHRGKKLEGWALAGLKIKVPYGLLGNEELLHYAPFDDPHIQQSLAQNHSSSRKPAIRKIMAHSALKKKRLKAGERLDLSSVVPVGLFSASHSGTDSTGAPIDYPLLRHFQTLQITAADDRALVVYLELE